MNWRGLLASCKTTDECYDVYVQQCNKLINQYVPVKLLREPTQICYPKSIRKLQAKVSRLYQARFVVGLQKYQRYSRKLKRELAQLSLTYEDKISDAETMGRFISSSIKGFVNLKYRDYLQLGW